MFPESIPGGPNHEEPNSSDSSGEESQFGASLSDSEFFSLFSRLDGDEVFDAGLKFVGLLRGF